MTNSGSLSGERKKHAKTAKAVVTLLRTARELEKTEGRDVKESAVIFEALLSGALCLADSEDYFNLSIHTLLYVMRNVSFDRNVMYCDNAPMVERANQTIEEASVKLMAVAPRISDAVKLAEVARSVGVYAPPQSERDKNAATLFTQALSKMPKKKRMFACELTAEFAPIGSATNEAAVQGILDYAPKETSTVKIEMYRLAICRSRGALHLEAAKRLIACVNECPARRADGLINLRGRKYYDPEVSDLLFQARFAALEVSQQERRGAQVEKARKIEEALDTLLRPSVVPKPRKYGPKF